MSPEEIRSAIAQNPKQRARDLAEQLGIGEAALVAASGGVALAAHPDQIMPHLCNLGEVMALTRNPSIVHEKIGEYANYHPGQHAAMILNEEIDLRIFPSRWVYAFAVESEDRRSIQVFDAAGDAVHKVFARETTNTAAWDAMVSNLRLPEQSESLTLTGREPAEAPKADPDKAEILRSEWRKMTDTHQFLRLTSKLKMNRLGAYRIAGAPLVRALAPNAFDLCLQAVAKQNCAVMFFVGNRGCIQIHSGTIETLKEMGPWQNVLDPRFNLHLRTDHVAEVWAVDKPTKRGMARSIECFDKEGGLIAQMFGMRKESAGIDDTGTFEAIVDALPGTPKLEAAS